MSTKVDADQRIAQVLEKIKNSIEQRSQLKVKSNKRSVANSDIQTIVIPEAPEESLDIFPKDTLIMDRKFINLDWSNKIHQGLTFKKCTISNSNFSGANLDGLRLECCNIFNSNFEKASIQDGIFEDCIFYEKQNQQGCNFRICAKITYLSYQF